MSLTNRVALITGASRGIGRAIALVLAREGCKVAVHYHQNRVKADAVVNRICNDLLGEAIAVGGDIANRRVVETMFRTVRARFGTIDIVVNNAGIYLPASLRETTDRIWQRTLDVNLTGVFLCIREAANAMVPRRYGRIINIASNSGFGVALWGDTSYAVSKAGVIQLTKNAAFELGQYGITVNAIAPGAIDTDMLRGQLSDAEYRELIESRQRLSSLEHVGSPSDIANIVLFLASDGSKFITGQTLRADGGRHDYL